MHLVRLYLCGTGNSKWILEDAERSERSLTYVIEKNVLNVRKMIDENVLPDWFKLTVNSFDYHLFMRKLYFLWKPEMFDKEQS